MIYFQNAKDIENMIGIEGVDSLKSELHIDLEAYFKGCRECGCSSADLNVEDLTYLFNIVSEACYRSGYRDGKNEERFYDEQDFGD